MSILGGLGTDESIKEDGDVLGGFSVLPSDIYALKVKAAYVTKAQSGAVMVNCIFETLDGKEVRENFCVASGDAKGNKNYYVDQRSGEKRYLPGFSVANSLSRLSVGKELNQLGDEEKVMNLYNAEKKKEIPTTVRMLTELLGAQLYGAIQHQVVDKTAKGDDGKYHPTGDTREQNEIVKFFNTDKKTTTELKAEAEAEFFDKWVEKNKGQVFNKAKGAKEGGKSAGTAPQASAKPAQSLFPD